MANRTLEALEAARQVANDEAALWFGRMARADQDGDKDSAAEYMAIRDKHTTVYRGLAELIAHVKEGS